MEKILYLLSSKKFLLAIALFLVVLVGTGDYLSGSEISFSLFYLLPISLISWYVSRTSGIVISILASLDWFLADWFGAHKYSHPAIPYWNTLVELSFFLIITNALASLRNRFDLEKTLARTDLLTNLANRRAFFEIANLEMERSRRYKHSLSLAYIDLDNFKWINDNCGHQTGDQVLVYVSNILKENCRKTDLIARLGGDEFALLLAETNSDNAASVVEKLQDKLLNKMQEKQWPITFSIGVVSFSTPPTSINQLIHEADILMYEVKKSGKNKIWKKTFEETTLLNIS